MNGYLMLIPRFLLASILCTIQRTVHTAVAFRMLAFLYDSLVLDAVRRTRGLLVALWGLERRLPCALGKPASAPQLATPASNNWTATWYAPAC